MDLARFLAPLAETDHCREVIAALVACVKESTESRGKIVISCERGQRKMTIEFNRPFKGRIDRSVPKSMAKAAKLFNGCKLVDADVPFIWLGLTKSGRIEDASTEFSEIVPIIDHQDWIALHDTRLTKRKEPALVRAYHDSERVDDTPIAEELGFGAVLLRLLARDVAGLDFYEPVKLELPTDRSITKLELTGRRLRALPPEIGDYANLEFLDASRNELTDLPRELAKLAKLKWLDLGSNKFGRLPEVVLELSQLETLQIGSCPLSELPPDFGRLQSLQCLLIYGVPMHAITSAIGDCRELRRLEIRQTQIERLPDAVSKLGKLEHLALTSNALVELPTVIGELGALQTLVLEFNKLAKLPALFGKLPLLAAVNLDGNPLLAVDELAQATGLTNLDLGKTAITRLPDLSASRKFRMLTMRDAALDELPASLLAMPELHYVDVTRNRLTRFPDVSACANLGYLYLAENQITEVLPSTRLPAELKELALRGNKLRSFPLEILSGTKIRALDLDGNPLDKEFVALAKAQTAIRVSTKPTTS